MLELAIFHKHVFTLVGRASISPLLQNANIFFGSEDDTNRQSLFCTSRLHAQAP